MGTAASVLAACGGGPGAPSGGETEKQAPDARTIARASEVRPGTAVKFEDSGGNPAVLVRLGGGALEAYSAVCTHEGCIVAYKKGRLVCPCHGSIFDPANNARVVSGPARLPLAKVRVAVKGGNIVRL